MTNQQNKIEKLIAKMCPDGVEFLKLGNIAEIKRGIRVTKKDLLVEGDYPVVSGGTGYMGYLNQYNREAETITIAQYGTAGYVKWQTEKFWANDVCFSVFPNKQKIINRYLYFFLKNKQEYLYKISNRNAVPFSIEKDRVLNLKIPIPPIEIQKEIVDILDSFTQLEAELAARRKQYEHYRNRLLTFTDIAEDPEGGVRWDSLENIFDIKNGYTPSKSKKEYWENGTIPWFRMEDIRKNGRILNDSIQHVNIKGVKNSGLFPANSLIFATTATIGEHALITVPSLGNQRFSFLTEKRTADGKPAVEIDVKFFFYYGFLISDWCKKNIQTSSFPSVDMVAFKKLKIPIPSLEKQREIVEILDQFDALVNDISIGLPAEIEARKKQYEYYRNQLLTFDELVK